MYSKRLQILVTPEQRRRWELEARRRGTSVAGLIRDSVDRDLGSPDVAIVEELGEEPTAT